MLLFKNMMLFWPPIHSLGRQLNNSMKFAVVILLAFLSISAAHSQGNTITLDSKNGFRDLKFGMPKKDIQGLESVCSQPGTMSISRRGADAKEIGEAKLDKIYYLFYQDSLAGVLIGFRGASYREEVIKTFIQAYGPCGQSAPTYDKVKKRTVTNNTRVKEYYEFDAYRYAYWKGNMVEVTYLPSRDFDANNCREIKLPDSSDTSMLLISSRVVQMRTERDRKKSETDKRAKALKDL